jgi:hypothetical protein
MGFKIPYDTGHKSLNHVLQVTTISKNQNLTKCFAKNKPVESTDYETGLPDATLTEA